MKNKEMMRLLLSLRERAEASMIEAAETPGWADPFDMDSMLCAAEHEASVASFGLEEIVEMIDSALGIADESDVDRLYDGL